MSLLEKRSIFLQCCKFLRMGHMVKKNAQMQICSGHATILEGHTASKCEKLLNWPICGLTEEQLSDHVHNGCGCSSNASEE